MLASIRDPGSAQAATVQLQAISQRFSDLQRRGSALFSPTPEENQQLARRFQGEIREAMDRLKREAARLTSLPGMGPAFVQLVGQINRASVQMEQALIPGSGAGSTGPQPYVEIEVRNVPDGDASGLIEEKLKALADSTTPGVQAVHSGNLRASSYRIWPVSDVQAFANRINFGKVNVSGRKVAMSASGINPSELAAFKARRQEARPTQIAQASPSSDPGRQAPSDADSITRSLFDLKASQPHIRRQGAERLARVAPEEDRRSEVVEALIPLADDDDQFTARESVKALANWGGPKATQALIKKVQHDDRIFVRRQAIEALGKSNDPAAAEVIAARLHDDWPDAGRALRAMGEVAEPALIAQLKNPETSVRREACDVLKDIGGKQALTTMSKMPADSDFGVRIAAQNAMRAIAARVGPLPKSAIPDSGTRRRRIP